VNHRKASLKSLPAPDYSGTTESLDRKRLLLLRFGKRFFGESPASLVSNWKFFQRADNIERVRTLSRGKNILK
jgi:hypothetical protein